MKTDAQGLAVYDGPEVRRQCYLCGAWLPGHRVRCDGDRLGDCISGVATNDESPRREPGAGG